MSLYSVPLPYQPDAIQYYAALADMPWAAWLDSGGMARYDILTAAPHHTLVLDDQIKLGDPFALLRSTLGLPPRDLPPGGVPHGDLPQGLPVASAADVPFAGGALGYWSYDLARRMKSLPCIARDAEHLPDMAVGIYDWALLLDHQQRTARLVSHRRYPETAEFLVKLSAKILQHMQSKPPLPVDTMRVHGKIISNFTPDSYARAFEAVQQHLQAGDCYQINLAQRFAVKAEGNAFGAYLRLRSLSPAPYSAFLNFPQAQILSSSPERFISVRDGKVETSPIKGTRPRSSDGQRDRQLADELHNHPKDRAENLMIVDLMRSDLGKSCVTGSVQVSKLFAVESFSNVHHLVSTITGKLAAGRDALDILRDCFPGGSVTGAPKQSAMQIIEQHEPNRRGIYCGAIGYVGFDGNMDSNIAIRTLVYSGEEMRCWAGGGIVADSDEQAEYQETLDKASGMLRLLQHYGGHL